MPREVCTTIIGMRQMESERIALQEFTRPLVEYPVSRAYLIKN